MSAAQKSECPGGAGHLQDQTSIDSEDCASERGDRKAFASIAAALALKGYTFHRLADGCLRIERWGYSRKLDSINQATQFLERIGGR